MKAEGSSKSSHNHKKYVELEADNKPTECNYYELINRFPKGIVKLFRLINLSLIFFFPPLQ